MSTTTPSAGAPWRGAETHARRRGLLAGRNALTRAVRAWFEAQDFTEVETAALQVSPGNEAHLHAFSNGLERDHAAVLAGLTLPYSSGAVEGKVCKIKFLKRLMFGRANYDLLRKMALLN